MKRLLFGAKRQRPKVKLRNADPPSPAFRQALDKYQETVAPKSGNDDGMLGNNNNASRRTPSPYQDQPDGAPRKRNMGATSGKTAGNTPTQQQYKAQAKGNVSDDDRRTPLVETVAEENLEDNCQQHQGSDQQLRQRGGSRPSSPAVHDANAPGPTQSSVSRQPKPNSFSKQGVQSDPPKDYYYYRKQSSEGSSTNVGVYRYPHDPYPIVEAHSDVASVYADVPHRPRPTEVQMPDTTYEETYGDAYVGAPMKYVYPSGYQSMRPRGGPWKLSICICLLFTWLSIFTVGYCSEHAEQEEVGDDAVLVIETRWCGSRLLYFMWVMSMLITGLATAYCSIIGYIKLRDFAVANVRSQPPGVPSSTSDYYIRIDDAREDQYAGYYPPAPPASGSISSSNATKYYQQTMYQADGTPQFWGGHIYRPTQAAVALTSR